MFMLQDHTGENLSEAMQSALESWGLEEDEQVCLTTDNGANNYGECCIKIELVETIMLWA